MQLARPTPELVAQYRSFWERRGLVWPGRPNHGIWATDGDVLVAAVGIHLSDAFIILEGYATNPVASFRQRHAATALVLESARSLAMMLDRTIILLPSPKAKGAIHMARRLGFSAGSVPPIFGVFR